MDENEFKRLVELVRAPLRVAASEHLVYRNVRKYVRMMVAEKDGAHTFPSTQELLDGWIADSRTDKNAWDTLYNLTPLMAVEDEMPPALVSWNLSRPARPRKGENDANRNRAILAAVALLGPVESIGYVGLKPLRKVDGGGSACDIVAAATNTTYSNIAGKWNKRPWKRPKG